MPDVVLRDVVAADLPTFFAQQQDPEANAMAASSARDHDAFIAHWVNILADDGVIKRTIVVEGDVAGHIVAFERDGRTAVGYWIGRAFWGRGIATAALRLFLEIVARRPLYAAVAAHNVASLRVLEKCGFLRAAESSADDAEVLLVLGLR